MPKIDDLDPFNPNEMEFPKWFSKFELFLRIAFAPCLWIVAWPLIGPHTDETMKNAKKFQDVSRADALRMLFAIVPMQSLGAGPNVTNNMSAPHNCVGGSETSCIPRCCGPHCIVPGAPRATGAPLNARGGNTTPDSWKGVNFP
ncbi:hypothetical protein T484DRAFT_1881297 [Baffinella frigidus]|nr:hypothetical protein T484DRAFT_1881297 [Cryptophyta sp. CCMP2293]